MPHQIINHLKIYYELHGKGEPVVLLSGFSNDHTVWNGIVDLLKADYQILVMDNRGAGQSDVPPAGYTIAEMAADVAELCAALGIQRAHFIGNSMGGFILQMLALQYPQLVKSAVFSNTASHAHCGYHIYAGALLKMLKANVPLDLLVHASCGWAFSYRFVMQPGRLQQLIDLGVNAPYPFTLTGFEGQYAAIAQFDSSEWVGNIRVPALVLSAEYDLIISEHQAKALAQAINAEYFCFPDCGHLPFLEYPQLFAEKVKCFLKQI